MRILRCIIWG